MIRITKHWYNSKTIWINVISSFLEIAQLINGINLLPAGTLTLITNLLNIILRFVTKAPLESLFGSPMYEEK